MLRKRCPVVTFLHFHDISRANKMRNCLEAIDKYYREMKYISVICDLSVANSAGQIIQTESMNSIKSMLCNLFGAFLAFDFKRFSDIIYRSFHFDSIVWHKITFIDYNVHKIKYQFSHLILGLRFIELFLCTRFKQDIKFIQINWILIRYLMKVQKCFTNYFSSSKI